MVNGYIVLAEKFSRGKHMQTIIIHIIMLCYMARHNIFIILGKLLNMRCETCGRICIFQHIPTQL